jgi:cytochrome b subunit of formate dehydrogenase
MTDRLVRWLLAGLGVVLAAVGLATILADASSGAQPWSSELSDNFVFAKAIPFTLGLGVVVGLLRGRSTRTERRADGSVRRYSTWTVVMHAVVAVGFLLALPTGAWQYLGGILDVSAPFPLFLVYRVHYIGAAVVLFAVVAFVTAWWYTGDRSLLVPRGAWPAHLRGLAYELPLPVGKALARVLRIDMRQRPPAAGRFTFYETAFSFPTWSFAIGLITITGLVKALRYVYPVPGPVLYWASTLHVAAMVLIALKTLDHLRYTIARWPLVHSMFTGWLRPDARPERAPVAAARRSPVSVGGDSEG